MIRKTTSKTKDATFKREDEKGKQNDIILRLMSLENDNQDNSSELIISN